MKATKLLSALFVAAFVTTAVSAQQTAVNPGKFSLHAGATALVFGGEPFGGIAFSMGLLTSPKDLFMLDFGVGFGPSERIGSYSYVTYREGSGSLTRHDDGKISYDYTSFETVLSYSRLFDMSEKWKFRVGPAIGITSIRGSDKYTDNFDGEVSGLPDPQPTSQNTFMGGVLAGVRWNFSPRGSLDITYLLSGNGKVTFEERNLNVFNHSVPIEGKEFGNVSHRFNFMVGWRIGRSKQ